VQKKGANDVAEAQLELEGFKVLFGQDTDASEAEQNAAKQHMRKAWFSRMSQSNLQDFLQPAPTQASSARFKLLEVDDKVISGDNDGCVDSDDNDGNYDDDGNDGNDGNDDNDGNDEPVDNDDNVDIVEANDEGNPTLNL
jgi:hypothetical protein